MSSKKLKESLVCGVFYFFSSLRRVTPEQMWCISESTLHLSANTESSHSLEIYYALC